MKEPTAAGLRFLTANAWYWDKGFEFERAVADLLYSRLKRMGMHPNEDGTYVTIAKRLKAMFPDLPVAPPL